MVRKILPLFILALLSVAACAQQTYPSVQTIVNIGEPARVGFVFGHAINGQPGTTLLEVQCDFFRAWLITNYDAVGQQSSNTFPITCTQTGQKSYVLNSTPLLENLTMTNGDQVALTIQSANWALVPCKTSRWGCSAGSSQITY